jgi:hypothetical protein
MVAGHDRHGGVVSETLVHDRLGQPHQGMPPTRRQWVAPIWKRLDTPMEVTMYAGRR